MADAHKVMLETLLRWRRERKISSALESRKYHFLIQNQAEDAFSMKSQKQIKHY